MKKLLLFIINFMLESDSLNAWQQEKIRNYAAKNQNINAILLHRDGQVIFAEYFNGFTSSESLFNLRSITKSVLSALIGIAIDRGFITGIKQNALEYFPEWRDLVTDQRFFAITIEGLLTMKSGIFYESSMDNFLKFKSLANPLQTIFTTRLVHNPGEVFNYSEVDAHLLSCIITKATGMNAGEFAGKYLFTPLKIDTFAWPKDPQGNNYGGSELQMKPEHLLRFGELYLNRGQLLQTHLVPAHWIAESTKKSGEGGSPVGESYGYLWWVTLIGNYPVYFAFGYGGQFLYIVPGLQLIIEFFADQEFN